MDEERIDLSALDPGADRLRYERMVRSVLARAEAETPSVAWTVVSQGKVAVVAAAALALLAWVPALGGSPSSEIAAAPVAADAASRVAEWALAGEVPPGASTYLVLGDDDAR